MRDNQPAPPRYPQPTRLAAGETRHWCGCGHSGTAPFCNDPACPTQDRIVYIAPRDEIALFCGCHGTRTPPLCDGTHAGLHQRPAWWKRLWGRKK
ncbi:CDGSH iron-sulfur domain-containing protein [Alloalcanivorax mobilis]|uniref:hypothetical protein n=1 Tax=Alloalcanivorax mobilis TaxID=2019569 RepID=UPI000C7666C1|nr:hypothetical protein [Alloalcanivorax mobilis]